MKASKHPSYSMQKNKIVKIIAHLHIIIYLSRALGGGEREAPIVIENEQTQLIP